MKEAEESVVGEKERKKRRRRETERTHTHTHIEGKRDSKTKDRKYCAKQEERATNRQINRKRTYKILKLRERESEWVSERAIEWTRVDVNVFARSESKRMKKKITNKGTRRDQ